MATYYTSYSGGSNSRGDIVEREVHDRGTYVEIITKVTKKDGSVDYYIEKKPK